MIQVHLTEAGLSKIKAVLPGHGAALVEEFSLTENKQEALGELWKELGKGR